MSELPENWRTTRIGEVADVNPRTQKDDLDDNTLASFVPMKCVEAESGRFAPPENKKVGEVKKGYTPMRDGDVIFAKVTPCMENGKAAVVRGLTNGIGFGSTEFYALRPKDNLVSEFLFYYIIQKGFRREAERHMTGAVGLRRVPKIFIEEHDIPLPPLPEQRRIVARIEELFSRIDAGVAALLHAKAQLQRYRQSVLAAAVTGQLTQAWREQHPHTKPAEELLERILMQRREQWSGKGKYKEPAIHEPEDVPAIPSAWKVASIDSVAGVLSGYAFKSGSFTNAGTPAIKITSVGHGFFNQKGQEFLPSDFEQLHENFLVRPGDLLLALTRPVTQNKVKSCFYPPDQPVALLNQRVASLAPSEGLNPLYFFYFTQSDVFRKLILKDIPETLQPNLSPVSLKQLPIPIPPLAEQNQIVAEVEARTTAIDHLEAELDRQITRANCLRQSTLSSAFQGLL